MDRETLCVLGREWLLHGHLQDRVGMPLVLELGDRDDMEQVAIEEWMAVSPVYSRRMQRALGFAGDTVDVIFKNMQLDIGAPHQFLDFRFRLADPHHGEFFLASCGALLDVEPMGEEFVFGMCHTIEDPTFDATAAAVNPLAQVRPVHRPPRVPAGRVPHCLWTVVVGDGTPVLPHPTEALVAASLAAAVELPPPPPAAEPGGWADYSGPLDPDFQLEDLSEPALRTALAEFALQSHLLLRGFLLAAGQRFGADRVDGFVPRILTGLGALTSERLGRALGLTGGVSGIAELLRVHPSLHPAGYLDVTVAEAADRVRLAVLDCPATAEPDGLGYGSVFGTEPGLAAMTALVRGLDPRAQVADAAPGPGEYAAYEITVDPDFTPVREPSEVRVARLSTGATFTFTRRRPLRV